jgi:nucleotide-binding universal stress UspA family protein
MTPFKRILVPVDFSPSANLAVESAIDLARRYDAALDLVYVYQSVAYALPDGYVLITPDQLNEILRVFETQLAAAKENAHKAGVAKVETALLQGYPINEILRRAEDRKAELIVMGTHGRSGIKRLVLGSVAENVLRSSSCPVLVIREPS